MPGSRFDPIKQSFTSFRKLGKHELQLLLKINKSPFRHGLALGYMNHMQTMIHLVPFKP